MSDARKCDRCGALYAEGGKGRVIHEYYSGSTRRTKNSGDMCPKCAAKFDRWWNKKRKGDSE